jgi:hypothetical protein
MKIRKLFAASFLAVLVFCLVFVFCAAVESNPVGLIVNKDQDQPKEDAGARDRVNQATTGIQPNYRDSREEMIGKTITVEVTGYYKPVPGQKHYALGSYEADVKMNGTGKTAIGESAYVGGAATSNFTIAPFESCWVIEGLGRVRVNDRKGKLTESLQLDIFCGEGDDGCDAALALGRKKLRARCVSR